MQRMLERASIFLLQAWTAGASCITDEVLAPLQGTFAKLCYQRESAASAGPEQFNIKMYNFLEPVTFEMWWDDGTEQGVLSGFAPYGKTWETLTYHGHRFRMRRPKSAEVVDIVTANVSTKLLILGSIEDTRSPMYQRYADARQRLRDSAEYWARAGRDWVGYPSRSPPSLPYVGDGAQLGDVLTLKSDAGFWTCSARAEDCESQPLEMQAQVVSVDSPRVLVVRNLLSIEEAELIVAEARPRLTEGTVGQGDTSFKSKSRNSKLVFLPWHHAYMKRIQSRMSDVLGIPMHRLRARSEPLQVVEYQVNQQYQPHLDAGTNSKRSRFLTLLVVFRPAEAGGCTSFPRAYGRKGLTVCLKAGDAVLFYSLLPDGNIDADSVHSGDLVHRGVKWVGNLWVSDDPDLDQAESTRLGREQEI